MLKGKTKKNKSFFIKAYGGIVKIFTAPTSFVYLGEKAEEPSLFLSNHAAAAGPLTWQYRFDKAKRFWATHENTEGVKSVYRYMSRIYFHRKRHISMLLSKVFAFFASPFISLFFTYVDPIPTFKDDAARFIGTLRESCDTLASGESIVVFPEDSSQGYFEKPKKFFAGFAVLGERMLRKGVDIPVFVSYFSKQKHTVLVDSPIRYSALKQLHGNSELIAEALRQRLNELADMVKEL